jgi:molecular chaperone GrpE
MTQSTNPEDETRQIPAEEALAPPAVELSSNAGDLIQRELQECKDKYLRLLAEAENTRKRLQKEKQDMMRFAIENVIAEFLTPMDNLENALKFTQNMSQETLNWARGFEMILGQFKDILNNHGISSFHSEGSPFDPHMHEAVEIEETDSCEEGTVLHEYMKGYKSGHRTIRPARVKVAKKTTQSSQSESENVTN